MPIQKTKVEETPPDLLEIARAQLPALALPDPALALGQFEAAVLRVQVTGVAGLTEGLAKGGREGAEEFTRILNAFLESLLAALAAQSGQVMRLEGDEVIACFPRQEGESADGCLQRAQAVAEALSQLHLEDLSVSSQAEFGLVRLLGFGTPGMGRELVLLGPTAVQAGAPPLLFRPASAGPLETEPQSEAQEMLLKQKMLARLIDWLPPLVWQKLKADPFFKADWQRVVVLCVQFEGPDCNDEVGLKQLEEYYGLVQNITAKYNGLMYRFQPGSTGEPHRLTLIFGTLLSGSDDAERALRVGLLLRHLPDYLDFIHNQGIGIASSNVFGGLVGTSQREQSIVAGDALAGAAAAAGKASQDAELQGKGSLLVDRYSSERVARNFLFGHELTVAHPVKNFGLKMAPLLAERNFVSALTRTWKGETSRRVLVGHWRERATLEQIAGEVLGGTTRAFILTGPEGSGKSALLDELSRHWLARAGSGAVGKYYHYGDERPYLGWTSVLAWLCGFRDTDTRLNRVTKINTVISQYAPDHQDLVTPLQQLLDVVPFDHLRFEVFAQFGQEREQFFDFFTRLVTVKSAEQPLLLGLENMQWSDPASRELLAHLLNELQSGVLFGLTSRHLLPDLPSQVLTIEVQPLNRDESQRLVQEVSNDPLSAQQLDELVALVGGNPRQTVQAVRFWQRYARLPTTLEEIALFNLASQ